MCNFKNSEEILKTWRKFAKNIWQPFNLLDLQKTLIVIEGRVRLIFLLFSTIKKK